MTTKRFGEDEIDAKTWDIPYVEAPVVKSELNKTNAINRRSDWVYEPPEPEEEILPPTAEEIEAIRQAAYEEGHAEGKGIGFEEGKTQGIEQGHQEGYQAGFEEGNQAGLNAAEDTINQLTEQWQSLISQVYDPLEQVNEQTRKEVVKLAVSLANAVIKTEVQTSQATILQALSEGLKALPINENRYQIHMHPEDIELVKNHFGDDVEQQKQWQFVESPGLHRGGCDITTSQNAVDVSVERRTREVLTQFLMDQGLNDE